MLVKEMQERIKKRKNSFENFTSSDTWRWQLSFLVFHHLEEGMWRLLLLHVVARRQELTHNTFHLWPEGVLNFGVHDLRYNPIYTLLQQT